MNRIIIVIVCLIAWEHIGRVTHVHYKPSTGLNTLATHTRYWFKQLGRLIGRISAFIDYLRCYEITESILELTMAFTRLFTSWTCVFTGYVEVILEYKWPLLCVVGTGVIVGCMYFILWPRIRKWIFPEPKRHDE